jgi:catechol 2,3-dioxygenase-like lactoylglutathione lyase family enzyme
MKLRTGNPWMSGADYGRSLSGFSVNLMVRQVQPALRFAREVLGADVVYADPDFAVLQACGAQWMLHADHCYDQHPMFRIVSGLRERGRGIELRLHGRDPDAAERVARQHGYTVLQSAADKRHGLREVYLVDDDGYVWVPDVVVTT